MVLGDRGSRWRCLLVWVSGTSVLGTAGLPLLRVAAIAWAGRRAVGTVALDTALTSLAACVLLGCVVWAWLGLSVAVAEARRGAAPRRTRLWHLPGGVRRVVLLACGVALTAGAVAPSVADAGPGHRQRHGVALLAGLPLPDRAVAPGHGPARAKPRGSVVVRPGDSLWSIARDDLPPGAADADVVERWHAIYADNRLLIGPDPDLIEPGQHLRLPRKDHR